MEGQNSYKIDSFYHDKNYKLWIMKAADSWHVLLPDIFEKCTQTRRFEIDKNDSLNCWTAILGVWEEQNFKLEKNKMCISGNFKKLE